MKRSHPRRRSSGFAAIADRLGVEIPDNRGYGHGKLVEELWEHTVGNALVAPTFVRDFPVETTPLTRQHRSIPGVTEKWDLYVRGIELATGYSELNDPVVQRERFAAQARAAAAGDDEAMVLDEDFLAALEYAMPPCTGTGMGIDRLLMCFDWTVNSGDSFVPDCSAALHLKSATVRLAAGLSMLPCYGRLVTRGGSPKLLSNCSGRNARIS